MAGSDKCGLDSIRAELQKGHAIKEVLSMAAPPQMVKTILELVLLLLGHSQAEAKVRIISWNYVIIVSWNAAIVKKRDR